MGEQMKWQKYEVGTGRDRAENVVSVAGDALKGFASPVAAMRATLIESDLDKIRQVMREELRQDWQEHTPFGEEMDEEEERKWQQTQQENDRRFLVELAQLVEASVRRAIYGDPPDPDDLPVRRNAPDPGGDADDERVEAHIVTVKDTPHVYHDATGTCVICSRCQGLMGFTIGQRNPEIRAFLKALEPFVTWCECKEQ
jgi:hypothetical protein